MPCVLAVLLAAALTHLSRCPFFFSVLPHFYVVAAAVVVAGLLLRLAPPLPVLHITTGFPLLLKIDQRRVRSQ